MTEEIYSSGLVSQSFWFLEIKKVIKLMAKGYSEEEIKKICLEENLFGAAKEYRAKRIYGYISNRTKKLDKCLIELFCETDLQTQKLINLVTILRSDRLFFEFLFEVYREKALLGQTILQPSDISIFFNNKEVQSEEIASWTDVTKKRLSTAYLTFLTDSNLVKLINKQRIISPPIMDVALERYLEVTGDLSMAKAIMGVR